ncbi:hypothetical protein OAV88_01280 [bacterium]|nr:hypothetical protein [bacterium]
MCLLCDLIVILRRGSTYSKYRMPRCVLKRDSQDKILKIFLSDDIHSIYRVVVRMIPPHCSLPSKVAYLYLSASSFQRET